MNFLNRLLSRFVDNIGDGFNWLIYEMDVTQWGIVAVLFVVTGFMALKTRF